MSLVQGSIRGEVLLKSHQRCKAVFRNIVIIPLMILYYTPVVITIIVIIIIAVGPTPVRHSFVGLGHPVKNQKT